MLYTFVILIFLSLFTSQAEDCSRSFFTTNLKSISTEKATTLSGVTNRRSKTLFKRNFEEKVPAIFDRLIKCQKINYSIQSTDLVLEFLITIRGDSTLEINRVLSRLFKLNPKSLIKRIDNFPKKDALYLYKQLLFSWTYWNPKSEVPSILREIESQIKFH
jgi:hypothetical protein